MVIVLPERDEFVKQELIDEVKRRFNEEYNQNPELYDERDLNRINTNDWWTKRYLLYRKHDVDKAFDLLKDNMKWRKEFGAWSIKASDFPREFFQVAVYHRGAPDKNNNIMFYNRGLAYRKVPEYSTLFQRYFIYLCETADEIVARTGNGVGIVCDFSGTTIANVDLDLLWFVVNAFERYPRSSSYLYVNNLPWLLIPVYNLVTSWFPEEYKRILCRGYTKDIKEMCGEENLPAYLEGQCPQDIHAAPNVCKQAREFGPAHDIPDKYTERLYELWGPYLGPASDALSSKRGSKTSLRSNYSDRASVAPSVTLMDEEEWKYHYFEHSEGQAGSGNGELRASDDGKGPGIVLANNNNSNYDLMAEVNNGLREVNLNEDHNNNHNTVM